MRLKKCARDALACVSLWGMLCTGCLLVPSALLAVEMPDWFRVRIDTGDLKGGDVDGKNHQFFAADATRGVALVFLSTECPISNSFVPELKKMAAHYASRGIPIYGVVSDPSATRAQAIQHRDKYSISFPMIFDGSRAMQKLLGPTHTPQVVIVSASGAIHYSGRINNLFGQVGRKRDEANVHDMRDALESLVNGRDAVVSRTTPIGCPMEQPPHAVDAGTVSFNRDVAPILYANCTECHRPSEAAPFSLISYSDACRHAEQIAVLTKSRVMPPWHPVPEFGDFRNKRRLSVDQIEILRQWVEDGLPEGDDDDLPDLPEFPSGWRLGRPDLVLRMPEAFELGPDGRDVHQHFVLRTGLNARRMVEAIEFRPGNAAVVHHASFYVDTSGAARRLAAALPDVGYGSFAGPGFDNSGALRSWLPGMSPQKLPDGYGRLLPANSDIVIEIHYRRTGKPETDRSTLGLHFAPASTKKLISELQVLKANLTIPAGEPRHHHHATYKLPVDACLLDAAPHMHLLGSEMKATATKPDGTVVPLIWVRDWDFNWQGQYLYVEPIRLPAGSRIDVHAWYDNTAQNPLNPHSPPQTVRWGDQSSDEMGICHFRYTCDSVDDLRTMNTHHVRFLKRQHGG